MDDYDPTTYGERIADHYDDIFSGLFDEQGAVELLAGLAGDGRALELGIGTGRIAIPLNARGVDVHGVDSSKAMIDKLREKPGGDDIPVTVGNFADVDVEGRFRLVYVPFNTFFALLTQDEQVRCFHNVGRHLTEDGTFVIEAFVPDPARFDRHQRVSLDSIDVDRVALEVSRHDPVDQTVMGQQIVITERGIRMFPVKVRYAYPSELDLMARVAGLVLRDRLGGWQGEPFTAASPFHISIYAHADRA